MRTISEQELKNILDRHGKWLRNEEGGERADLRSADLSYANLSSADLRYADLRSADLSSANLRSADLRYADLSYADLSYANLSYADLSYADLRYADLMTFQFQKHTAYFTFDGSLRIGCEVMSIADWSAMYEGVGQAQGYTPEQIAAYGGFIKLCLEMFKARNP